MNLALDRPWLRITKLKDGTSIVFVHRERLHNLKTNGKVIPFVLRLCNALAGTQGIAHSSSRVRSTSAQIWLDTTDKIEVSYVE